VRLHDTELGCGIRVCQDFRDAVGQLIQAVMQTQQYIVVSYGWGISMVQVQLGSSANS
jgi:hypothetical protein